MDVIHVDAEELEKLKTAIMTAGQDYKEYLAKLTNLIDEITADDIQGDLADELKIKFEQKRTVFMNLKTVIEMAEGYMGLQVKKFGTMMEETKSSMK